MNKKNMAVVMSATMVASSVAPIFATGVGVETEFVVNASNKDAITSKVGELLGVKYTSKLSDGDIAESTESVYEIKVGMDVVTNKTDFKNKLNAVLEENTLAAVTIKDKGHKVVEDGIINYEEDKYTLSTLLEVVEDETLADYIDGEVEESNGRLTITLLSGEVIELGVGDTVLDFTKAYDAEGEETETPEDVVSFGLSYSELEEVEYTVNVTTTEIKEISADLLFDGAFLTEEGEKLLTSISESETHDIEVNEIMTENEEDEEVLTALEIVVKRKPSFFTATEIEEGQDYIITVNGTEEQLTALKGIFVDSEAVPNKLAGQERFDTAVEVSKAYREQGGTSTGAVVLASATSLVDGLAAGPLAAKLDTSILLTNADSLPEVTKEEIKAVLDIDNTIVSGLKDKTVYVIGGEAVISENVVAELEAIGVTVERIAGENRHETSLAVANKLEELGATTESFVVGADGLADAMSISAYAAKSKNAIIVSNFGSTMSEDAMEYLAERDLTIVGGKNAVSTELESELDEANEDKTVLRLEGETRFETNAEVINHFHKDDVDAIFVAKDGYKEGNDKLVDALTAAPLAAKLNAPIVLATNDLTEAQEEVLELMSVDDASKIYQVGGGVATTLVNKLVNLFK